MEGRGNFKIAPPTLLLHSFLLASARKNDQTVAGYEYQVCCLHWTLTRICVRVPVCVWCRKMSAGNDVWMHGLWAWNWADSHRPVLSIDTAAEDVTIGDDDYNHDVNPIKKGSAGSCWCRVENRLMREHTCWVSGHILPVRAEAALHTRACSEG